MAGTAIFSEGYIASTDALVEWCGVSKRRQQWRAPLTSAHAEALAKGQDSFQLRVPIEFGNFMHPRYFRTVTFQTRHLENVDGLLGVHEDAKESFVHLVRNGIEKKPQGMLDYRQVAAKFKDDPELARMTDLNDAFEQLFQSIRVYLEEIIAKRANAAEERNDPQENSVKFPKFFHKYGMVFRTSDFQYCFYDKDTEEDQLVNGYKVFVRDDPKVLDKLRARFIHTANAEIATPIKTEERPGESYAEILGMTIPNVNPLRRTIEDGYVRWQVKQALAEETGEEVDDKFTVILRDPKTPHTTVKITIPVSECGYFRSQTDCDFGITRKFLRENLLPELPLKWLTYFNQNLPDEGMCITTKEKLKPALRDAARFGSKHVLEFDVVKTSVDNIFTELLDKKTADGVVEVSGLKIDLSKDVKFSRVKLHQVYMSDDLIARINDSEIQTAKLGRFVSFNQQLPERDMHLISRTRTQLNVTIRGMLLSKNCIRSDHTEIVEQVKERLHKLFDNLLDESKANGDVIMVDGYQVDLSKDLKFTRATGSYQIYVSGELLDRAIDKYIQEKAAGLTSSSSMAIN